MNRPENAAGPWTQFYVGKKSSTSRGTLDPGEMYYFRVRAVGPLGPGPWSDIAQKRTNQLIQSPGEPTLTAFPS